jgi:hypothetical protein
VLLKLLLVSLAYQRHLMVVPAVALSFFVAVTVCGLDKKAVQVLLVNVDVPLEKLNRYLLNAVSLCHVIENVQVEPAAVLL